MCPLANAYKFTHPLFIKIFRLDYRKFTLMLITVHRLDNSLFLFLTSYVSYLYNVNILSDPIILRRKLDNFNLRIQVRVCIISKKPPRLNLYSGNLYCIHGTCTCDFQNCIRKVRIKFELQNVTKLNHKNLFR